MSRVVAVVAVPLLFALLASAPALAATPREQTLEFDEFDFGISPVGIELDPGMTVTVHVVNKGASGPHNLYFDTGGALAKSKDIGPGEGDSVTFQVPSSGIIQYYCNIAGHLQLGMLGNLTVRGSAPAATGKPISPGEVRVLGIQFFAYWVGVISFIVLFVVLAATFFLLRYGETQHWTDQRDRPSRDKGEEKPKTPFGTYAALGLSLIVLLVAVVQVLRLV